MDRSRIKKGEMLSDLNESFSVRLCQNILKLFMHIELMVEKHYTKGVYSSK